MVLQNVVTFIFVYLKNIESSLDEGKELIASAKLAGERIFTTTSMPGCNSIRQELQLLADSLTAFMTHLDSAWSALNHCQNAWTLYNESYDSFSTWVESMALSFSGEANLKSTLSDKEKSLEEHQVWATAIII